MSEFILKDLDHNRKRLEYYSKKAEVAPGATHQKWIDIYASRISAIETKAKSLGLIEDGADSSPITLGLSTSAQNTVAAAKAKLLA